LNLRPTLIKLTLWYLLLIMLVSGVLSVIVYTGGSQPLNRRVEIGDRIFIEEDIPPGFPPEQMRPRLNPFVANEVKHNLALFLIYFNIGVFCIAGVVSYSLARRELKPVEEAMELQNRFTSDAAHELRTPLTAMKAEIEVALRGGELAEAETRELLESNLEEIGKLDALSSSLLKLAQYEEGAAAPEVGVVDLRAVIEESVEKVMHTAKSRGITISIDAEEAPVTADRTGLVEMLVILLDNSIKYSDDGTSIAVSCRRQKRNAQITVADEGFGIEAADLAHVFERFYRGKVPASKGQVDGHGLGLSIARRIAEKSHGSLELESEPGKGTTAIIRLPLSH
jgi:two-component system, OmpR family, sensor histidine kinase CiaH